ncbi:hypothetical protein SteCoe_35188 [Stentor coeruleus]|uniref:Protein FAM221A n=1 Tax=Stentor coeruleus TaxID=5963 RepID=A0A1R2ASX7_9CILI|nr:hypothetical protein SteCoe_35188 [Stentor coeruleus]
MERIQLNSKAAEAVQAYIEYENIVGGADGGKLLSPAEYEEFKKQVSAQRANRLFVYWTNSQGLECKTIGPFSKCFCDHRYKEHLTDNLKTKKVPCKVPKCKCKHFNYVPIYGSNDLKCLCKHSFKEHDPLSKKCERAKCKCTSFSSTHSCSCSLHYNAHGTSFYTKDERIAMGKPVDNLGGGGDMYAALGGLTDFSDLVDGVERLQAAEYLEGHEKPRAIEETRDRNVRPLPGPVAKTIGKSREVTSEVVRPDRRAQVTALELYNLPHRYKA